MLSLAAALTALAACGGGSATVRTAVPPGPSGANALRVTVNGALCSPGSYVDKPCVEITVCTPDQVSCQTVSDVLLDTGSFGLRLFRQAFSLDLPAVTAAGGTVATCTRFGDGSSDWGPVERAAVLLGQEPAVVVPIHVIDSTFGPPPASCTSPEASPAVAGLNGILGVGPFLSDCGPGCAASAANGVYFTCRGGSCTGYAAPESSQVQNPAALLDVDGAGLLVRLPSVPPAGLPSVDGEVVLGVGTRANNAPSGVTALALDGYGELRVTTMGKTYGAYADTGSNGLFFNPPTSVTTLPACTAPAQDWYCPASTLHFDAAASPGGGGAAVPFGFEVANFDALASGPDAVFGTDAGTGLGTNLFDLGLPFHLGRDVWIGFEGRTSPLGTGPLVAF